MLNNTQLVEIGKVWNNVRIVEDPLEHVSKYIFTNESAVAEAVLYRYPTYKERTVICCSTQSGCPVGCRFCGAGESFVKSLTVEEIVSQVTRLLDDVFDEEQVLVSEMGRCQIMFMSMGEPLLNTKHLSDAIRELHRLYPTAALLISTSAPDVDYMPIHELSAEIPTVGLQFSVHESTDEARDKLIPFKAKLCLQEIAYTGEFWKEATGRMPYFNYCAHDGNVSDEDADRLLALFHPETFCATVSVICERDEGMQARNEHQRKLALDFGEKLLARGYDVRVFDPAGQDTIGGGCGQLHFVQKWFSDNQAKVRPTAGAGLEKIHVPNKV